MRGLTGGPQQIAVHVGGERIKLFTVGGPPAAGMPRPVVRPW